MDKDMSQYIKQIKENIKLLIHQNRLDDAKIILNQYENIGMNDIDIYSTKAVIAMMEGCMEEAEKILKEGLNKEKENFDLLYNLAYLYQSHNRLELAAQYYKKAFWLARTKEDSDAVNNILRELGVEEDNKSLMEMPKSCKKILYLGWLGKGNVGDDLLFEIFKKMFYGFASNEKYNVSIDPYCPVAGYEVDLYQYDLIVLGGGSLFILEGYEILCLKAIEYNIPIVTWGTGIDIRDEKTMHSVIDAFENNRPIRFNIENTFHIVDKAKLVSARGKVDRFILLQDKVRVIGDPCIIFDRLNNIYPKLSEVKELQGSKEEIVLINWGTSYNNIAGKDEKLLEEELRKATEHLLQAGYKVIVYPIWTEDIRSCINFTSYFKNPNIRCIEKVYDVYGLASLIRSCKFTINLKLHANILSMAMKKPFISLAYGLKCYDFAESIDSLDLILTTDAATADKIIDKVKYIEGNYMFLEKRFVDFIDFYQKQQWNFMNQIVSLLDGNSNDAQRAPESNGTANEKASFFKSIGKNVQIENGNQFIEAGNMEIGDNVYIGFGGFFVASGGIRIGNGSILAHKVEIMTRNHNYDSTDLQSIPYDGRYIYKPVIIEENVWVGANVCIVPGVTIGEGAVIGMGSVVTKNVPKYAVVGGNPVKILKYRDKEAYGKLKSENKIYLAMKHQQNKNV